MASNNRSGGDNQQETAWAARLDPGWICGFVDGEGCFSVSIHYNPLHARRSFGWQINPVFQVSQHERHQVVLEELAAFFGCGKVRGKGPGSVVLVYAVDRTRDLESFVLPFFERHSLRVKHADFAVFAAIVRAIRRREHFSRVGFERVIRLAYSMNEGGKQRKRPLDHILVGSSETAREAPGGCGRVKIQSELHGDMQSQAEMT